MRTLLTVSSPEATQVPHFVTLHRIYLIIPTLVIKLPKETKSAVRALQKSQKAFFGLPVAEKTKFNAGKACPGVDSYGFSAVVGLKEYYQARAGGEGSNLAYPAAATTEPTKKSPDFGISCIQVYRHLDTIGRGLCLKIIESLGLTRDSLDTMLDPAVADPESVNIDRDGTAGAYWLGWM